MAGQTFHALDPELTTLTHPYGDGMEEVATFKDGKLTTDNPLWLTWFTNPEHPWARAVSKAPAKEAT